MIARTNPIVMGALVSAALIATALPVFMRSSAPAAPLAGILFSPSSTQPGASGAPALPTIEVGVASGVRALLPADEVLVRFVTVAASTFTLTLAREAHDTQRTLAAARRTPRPQVAVAPQPPAPSPALAAAAVVAAVPPPAPVPTLPTTFTELDEALRGSSTTKAINLRLKKGGVSFRLTHIGRVADRFVVRYAIANEEATDFFLSIVNAAAAGKAIHSETAGPYACPPGQEIVGVVHFAPADVAGRPVGVELVQSGGDRRRFPLSVQYSF